MKYRNQRKARTKIIALVATLALVMGLLPMAAFATTTQQPTGDDLPEATDIGQPTGDGEEPEEQDGEGEPQEDPIEDKDGDEADEADQPVNATIEEYEGEGAMLAMSLDEAGTPKGTATGDNATEDSAIDDIALTAQSTFPDPKDIEAPEGATYVISPSDGKSGIKSNAWTLVQPGETVGVRLEAQLDVAQGYSSSLHYYYFQFDSSTGLTPVGEPQSINWEIATYGSGSGAPAKSYYNLYKNTTSQAILINKKTYTEDKAGETLSNWSSSSYNIPNFSCWWNCYTISSEGEVVLLPSSGGKTSYSIGYANKAVLGYYGSTAETTITLNDMYFNHSTKGLPGNVPTSYYIDDETHTYTIPCPVVKGKKFDHWEASDEGGERERFLTFDYAGNVSAGATVTYASDSTFTRGDDAYVYTANALKMLSARTSYKSDVQQYLGNRVFQAVFYDDSYTLGFNGNGGTVNGNDYYIREASSGSSFDFTLDISTVVPTRSGYTFKGWCTDKSNPTGTLITDTTPTNSSSQAPSWFVGSAESAYHCELYAVWEQGAMHTHTLVKTEAVAATCETAGTEAYWTCSGCGKLFSDAAGTNEISAPTTIAALGHKWDAGKVTTEPTCTAAGVRTYTCAHDATHTKTETIAALGHDWGDWVLVAEATESDEGLYQRTCARCGEVEEKPLSQITPEYRNTEGDGSVWTEGSGEALTFRFKRNINDSETFSHFLGIQVDGADVDESNYTAEPGSVIVKLSASYMATLPAGDHTITAIFDDGNNASATFTVKAAAAAATVDEGDAEAAVKPAASNAPQQDRVRPAKSTSPQTGDSALPLQVALALAGAAACALAVAAWRLRSQSRSGRHSKR